MKQQNAKNRIQVSLSQQLFGDILEQKRDLLHHWATSGKIKQIDGIEEMVQISKKSINRDNEHSQRNHDKQKQSEIVNQMQKVQMKIVSEDFNNMFDNKYKIIDTIGEGANAVVKKVASKFNQDQIFAVKIVRSGDPEIISTFIDTYKNSRFLNHPYIIKSNEIYIDEQIEALYQIMEYSNYPSLQKVLKRQKFLKEIYAQKLVFQMATAIKHMHERGISHRDLKPDNILVDYTFEAIKIIDFGVSKRFRFFANSNFGIESKFRDMWTRTGNYLYLAPEIYHGGGYNEKIDMWALGILLYQMLTGKILFHQETIYDTIEMITQFNGNLDLSQVIISNLAKDCLRRLLNPDPQLRISAEECLRHPWFYFDQNENEQLLVKSSPILEPSPVVSPVKRKFVRKKNSKSSTFFKEFPIDPYQQKNEMVQFKKINSEIGKEIHIHRKIKKTFSFSYLQMLEDSQN